MSYSGLFSASGLLLVMIGFINCSAGSNEKDFTTPGDTSVTAGKFKLVRAFPNLQFQQPVELTSADDGSNRIFLIEQEGRIRVFKNENGVQEAGVFLDIESRVKSGGEMGLLGVAFHPNYRQNGFFYVNYTAGNPLETRISRFQTTSGSPDKADPATELILLRYDQPFSNHNGGKVAFGNDGYLYISAGDGGSWGDPGNRSQNRKELLGKIMRIDVDRTSAGLNYGIPGDNPYVNNTEGFRPEIYAYGLRNVWRFNFDRETGLLWAGDVGQNRIEEVDIITKGGNYGWNIMEANECYRGRNCDRSGLTDPVWSYQQGSETGKSVTGGYVCRDKNLPSLNGRYVYGDFVSGNIWALTVSNNRAVRNELIAKATGGLSSFGEDGNKTLYVLSYGEGKVYKLAPAD
jgi:glucose/arabinose dehydrogenase